MNFEAGNIRIGCVRMVVRRRGRSGVVVLIEVDDGCGWRKVVKIDAFGNAHWHLYTRRDGEHVTPLGGLGPLRGGGVVVERLPRYLEEAGYFEVSNMLLEPEVLTQLCSAVYDRVQVIMNLVE